MNKKEFKNNLKALKCKIIEFFNHENSSNNKKESSRNEFKSSKNIK